MKIHHLFVLFPLTLPLTITSFANQYNASNKPEIQHGISYQSVDDITQYFVSEKLDGVRGYWNGKQLLTRKGNIINAPQWFTRDWPEIPMDGELWIDRNKFEALLSCVSRKTPDKNTHSSCWKNVRFMMFDLPEHSGNFERRVWTMQNLLRQIHSPYLAMIDQTKLATSSELEAKLADIMDKKGEGLMLHLASAHYQTGRNTALMKLKKHQDAEATIIAHSPGKGKYQGQLGALQVQMDNGVTFKIGSGFSDKLRANPPSIGTVITFKYNGLTSSGIPKFARFWRLKAEDTDKSDG